MEYKNFKILVVCTGNLCRSPIAEHLLRAQIIELNLGDYWSVKSAGTQAVEGTSMDYKARQILHERDIDPVPNWTTTLLNAGNISEANLILTAELDHRKQVVAFNPRAVTKVFTIRQFAELARLAAPLPAQAREHLGAALLESIVIARAQFQTTGSLLNIEDPLGQSIEQFRSCADEITCSITTIVAPLAGNGA